MAFQEGLDRQREVDNEGVRVHEEKPWVVRQRLSLIRRRVEDGGESWMRRRAPSRKGGTPSKTRLCRPERWRVLFCALLKPVAASSLRSAVWLLHTFAPGCRAQHPLAQVQAVIERAISSRLSPRGVAPRRDT
eukprot:63155-Prymnesium_polylepis.1